ncbi:hypothetical protein KKA27_01725 [Patescibacteria group bacterium]|nr:hypothetical protein [Patescibacteria group bacterium]
MSIFNWRAKKQLIFFLIVAFFVLAMIVGIIYWNRPEATCFDNKQNQDEESVDCGGGCTPCVVNPKDVVTMWTRVFEVSDGVYEVASLIKNPNLFYGMPRLKYTFKIYDSVNVLVAIKEGQTFLNPQDEFLIFETGIKTGKRDVAKAFVEIEPLSEWKYTEEEKLALVVSEKNFSNYPLPTMRARLFNESLFSVKDIAVTVVLYDKDENAIAVSSTNVDLIAGKSIRDVVFTWGEPLEVLPSSSKIFTRVNGEI